MVDWIELCGNLLLFALVFGMSATVDIRCLKEQIRNRKAILTGVFLQFIVLPLLGFLTVEILNLSHSLGIMLLVVTSSPGGSYSNWWCSLFNADLALSVTMTAISTMLSTIFLPLNLVLYCRFSYGGDILASLDWPSLFLALLIVIAAISLGIFCSAKVHSHKFNLQCNRLGNFAGIALVIFSGIMSNTDADAQIWERPWKFYVGTAMPCLAGLLVANVTTTILRLRKPERVTVSVECCYQNVGIATSVALTMFDGDELSEAIGVPFFYGTMEAVILAIYCLIMWKAGWTKAPKDAPIWKVLITSYEVLEAERAELESIEVSISDSDQAEEMSDKGDTLFHYFNFGAPPVDKKEPSGELDIDAEGRVTV